MNAIEKGRQAYERDVKYQPTYHDGTPRKTWLQLCEVARWSWVRNPTERHNKKLP